MHTLQRLYCKAGLIALTSVLFAFYLFIYLLKKYTRIQGFKDVKVASNILARFKGMQQILQQQSVCYERACNPNPKKRN